MANEPLLARLWTIAAASCFLFTTASASNATSDVAAVTPKHVRDSFRTLACPIITRGGRRVVIQQDYGDSYYVREIATQENVSRLTHLS
jgi:hypothetical protein